jgi:hypothetical protein
MIRLRVIKFLMIMFSDFISKDLDCPIPTSPAIHCPNASGEIQIAHALLNRNTPMSFGSKSAS